MDLKAAVDPAEGSVARSKASRQSAQPSRVVKTCPGAMALVTEQTLTEAQLTSVSPAPVMRTGGLQLAPPSVVVETWPVESTAVHMLVVGQLMPVKGCPSDLAGQVWPLSIVE